MKPPTIQSDDSEDSSLAHILPDCPFVSRISVHIYEPIILLEESIAPLRDRFSAKWLETVTPMRNDRFPSVPTSVVLQWWV